MTLQLIGYRFSVYTWAVRMALAEAGQVAEYTEINPFDHSTHEALRVAHPFARVPVLWDDDFRLFETAAILAYLLPMPDDRRAAARVRQVAGIVDAYAYTALVRQVFSGAVFKPAIGQPRDEDAVRAGLAEAPVILKVLNEIAAEGLALTPGQIGPADCHLAPMLGYFAKVAEGRDMLLTYPALFGWYSAVSHRASFIETTPDLSRAGETS